MEGELPNPAAAKAQASQTPAAGSEVFLFLWRHRGFAFVCLDAVTVVSSFMLAYYLRFYAEFLAIKNVPIAEVHSYVKGAILLSVVWVFFIWRSGGYETGLHGVGTPTIRHRSLLMSGVYAMSVLMVVSFMYRGLLLSRQVYLMTGILSLVTMLLVRLLFRAIGQDLAAQGIAVQNIAVVGIDEQAKAFAQRLQIDPGVFRILGFMTWNADPKNKSFLTLPVLGELADIRSVFSASPFKNLILSSTQKAIASGLIDEGTIVDLVNFCEEKQVSLYMTPSSFDVAVSHREIGSFSGMVMIRLRDASLNKMYAVIKRLLDFALAGSILVLGMPVWLLIALLIRLSSQGAVLFAQERAGLHGIPFKMYKFRSMVQGAEEILNEHVDIETLEEPVFKINNDPRVTRIGAFLRRYGLDEIPQLYNVLKGEMSLVGPRPEELLIIKKYNQWQRRRLKAKPGITGYQQINNRGEPDLAERIKFDLIYLKHQSFLLDFYIILKTFVVLLRGQGVTH